MASGASTPDVADRPETLAETGDVFETLAFFPSTNDGETVAFAATLRTGGAGIFTVDQGQIVQVMDTEGESRGSTRSTSQLRGRARSGTRARVNQKTALPPGGAHERAF